MARLLTAIVSSNIAKESVGSNRRLKRTIATSRSDDNRNESSRTENHELPASGNRRDRLGVHSILRCGTTAARYRHAFSYSGRSHRSRQRREPNCPRRVGPQGVQDFGLRAEVEVPAAQSRATGISGLISGPCAGSGRTIWATIKRWRPSGKPPSCHMGNASTVVPRDHELGRAPLTRGVGLVHSSRIRSNQRSAARKGSPRRSR